MIPSFVVRAAHLPHAIRRRYDDGHAEPWSGGHAALFWTDYVRDMLRRHNRPAVAAVDVRLGNGQLVSFKPKARR